jgi:hypothetical protein
MAATIAELAMADDPRRWEALGFALDRERCQIGTVVLRFRAPNGDRGIVGWELRGLDSVELDGLPTTIATDEIPAPAPAHPNGVVRIDHVVAASPQLDRTTTVLSAAGLDLRRVREEPTPTGAPRQAFFRLGEEILEVIQEPAQALERAGGSSDGPARFWGLALVVEDIERTVAALGEAAGEVRPAVQPGRLIAPLRRSAGLSVPLALMSGDDGG